MSQGRPALRLEVPSETGFLGLVRDVARKMAEVAGFEDKTADQLALAVDEAATNVVEHAYHGAPDRVVRVDMDDQGDAFCVDVVDDGEISKPSFVTYATERPVVGTRISVMISSAASAVCSRSTKKSSARIERRPRGPMTSISASSASIAAG